MSEWYDLDADKAHIAKERKKAQDLKKTQWWKNKLSSGVCQLCGKKFTPKDLTMDHIVPVARGGTSSKGNVVVACRPCNQSKKLQTPVELLLLGNDSEKNNNTED